MDAIIIRPNTPHLTVISLPKSSEAARKKMQTMLDGWPVACFAVRTAHGSVVGYCDDEFILKERDDFSCALDHTLHDDPPFLIGGPLIISGVYADGAPRGLTQDEIDMFTLFPMEPDEDGYVPPILNMSRRNLHPITVREGFRGVYQFTRRGLPLGTPVFGRKLSVVDRQIGPKHDPYTLRTYRVRITLADAAWAEWVLESDALAEEDRMYVRTSARTESVQIHSMGGPTKLRGLFEKMAGVRVSKFLETMERSTGRKR
jgi:hypothetical protein